MRRPTFLGVLGLLSMLVPVLSLGVSAWAEVKPQRNWQQIQLPHFTVMGDVGARELRRAGERMEQLHELLTMLTPGGEEGIPDTTVVVFRDRGRFLEVHGPSDREIGGYFATGPMNYVVTRADLETEHASVVYHEYVHLVLNRSLGTIPLWINEGLAEYYSTFEVTDGGRTARLGRVPMSHVWRLKRDFLPLTTLAAIDSDSPYYREHEKATLFYAESWALIHYLQLGQERKYAARLGPFLDAIAGGTPFAAACTSILGIEPKALEEELRAYLDAPVFFRINLKLPDRLERLAKVDATSVPEAQVHATLARLVAADPARAREHLEHAIRVDPSHALALASLARLDADTAKSESALALARRAGESPSPTYVSEFYRALALADLPEARADVARALRRSIALNPRFADGQAALAEHLSEAPEGVAEARTLLLTAMKLAPAREHYRLSFARTLLLDGRTQDARGVLGPLLARGSSARVKSSARDLLSHAARIDRAVAEGAAATAPPPLPAEEAPPEAAPSASRSGLALRAVAAGEARVFGSLTTIDCSAAGVLVVVATEGGAWRASAPAMERIDFVSYRPDLAGSVACGARSGVTPVLVTYRPSTDGADAGVVVAIEFVPDDFRPPVP